MSPLLGIIITARAAIAVISHKVGVEEIKGEREGEKEGEREGGRETHA